MFPPPDGKRCFKTTTVGLRRRIRRRWVPGWCRFKTTTVGLRLSTVGERKRTEPCFKTTTVGLRREQHRACRRRLAVSKPLRLDWDERYAISGDGKFKVSKPLRLDWDLSPPSLNQPLSSVSKPLRLDWDMVQVLWLPRCRPVSKPLRLDWDRVIAPSKSLLPNSFKTTTVGLRRTPVTVIGSNYQRFKTTTVGLRHVYMPIDTNT